MISKRRKQLELKMIKLRKEEHTYCVMEKEKLVKRCKAIKKDIDIVDKQIEKERGKGKGHL